MQYTLCDLVALYALNDLSAAYTL